MRRAATLVPVLAGILAAPAGCAATASRELVVNVRITGGLERSGTYAHPAGLGFSCGWLHTLPEMVPGQPVQAVPALWEVNFDPGARPPANSFRLSAPERRREDQSRALGDPWLRLTAGGRVWATDPDRGAVAAWAEASPDGLTGRFRAADLRPDDGGPERIAVEGDWRCPARD